MNLQELLLTLIGSGTVAAIVSAIASRPKATAEKHKIEADAEGSISEHYDTYADRLEERIERLSLRQDMYERRENIFRSAISCAYRCKCGECPVLEYLSEHPIPEEKIQ